MKKILLVVAIVASAISLNAQRTVDMQTTLVTPTSGQTIRSGWTFTMSVSLKNLGPDMIKTGDTARILWYHNNNYTGVNGGYIFTKDLEKDSSLTLFLNGLSLSGGQAATPEECAVAILWNRGTDKVIDTLLTDANNKSCVTVNYTVGIKEVLAGDQSVKIYPNPVTTEGVISYNLAANANVSVKLFDLTGREVSVVFDGEQTAGEQAVKFNTENLKNGIYMYQLSIDGIVATDKIIVNK